MSDSEGKLTTAIVIGAGQRGFGYAHYQEIKPEEFQVKGSTVRFSIRGYRLLIFLLKKQKLL